MSRGRGRGRGREEGRRGRVGRGRHQDFGARGGGRVTISAAIRSRNDDRDAARGRGTIPARGSGTIPARGSGTIPARGSGTIPARGGGNLPSRPPTQPPTSIMFQNRTQEAINMRRLGLDYAGFNAARQRVSDRTNHERFSAHYGVSAATAYAVFLKVNEKYTKMKKRDFFLALNYLKLYETYPVMSGRWKLDEDTIASKWKTVVEQIASLRSEKIVFDPSLFDKDEVFWFTVDGVNFATTEPRSKDPGPQNYDFKSNSAGVSYEVAVAIRHNKIVHIAGPFKASTSEIQRFRGRKAKESVASADKAALIFKIPDGKRCVADSGMKGEPSKITTARSGHAPDTKKFLARAKARQETLFKRFKDWAVLRNRFRHDISLHERCLVAIAVIVQIDFDEGNGLFDM